MFKRVLLILLAIVITIAIVVAVRTSMYTSKQIIKADGVKRSYAIDEAAVKHLSDAIKIPTISYDDTAINNHNQAVYDSFFTFLKTQYPAVFTTLGDTIINQRSMLLKWEGSNTAAKPVIYYAHLDVVPYEDNSLNQWKHHPFSGDVADGYIWGRGALDDKGSLIGIFEAVNRLLAKGFTPARTVYFAFGSDEEIGGHQGAGAIAEYFRKQGTKFEFYVDEGGMVSEGIVPNIKRPVALIGTAEKGYVTFDLSVNINGGHSSRPAKETSLDILVAAVKKLHDNPDKRSVAPSVNEFMAHVGPEMGMPLKAVFANRWLFNPLILNEYEKTAEGAALLRTTEVVTVMNAGVKENVIPSLVSAKVNYRILTGQTVKQVEQRAKEIINDPRVKIKADEVYEPSGNSSSETYGFKLMQQTAAQVYPDAIVTPFLMLGSTDSKHFSDITENTYRFFPARMDGDLLGGIHGINERIKTADFMETIAFYEVMLTNLK